MCRFSRGHMTSELPEWAGFSEAATQQAVCEGLGRKWRFRLRLSGTERSAANQDFSWIRTKLMTQTNILGYVSVLRNITDRNRLMGKRICCVLGVIGPCSISWHGGGMSLWPVPQPATRGSNQDVQPFIKPTCDLLPAASHLLRPHADVTSIWPPESSLIKRKRD